MELMTDGLDRSPYKAPLLVIAGLVVGTGAAGHPLRPVAAAPAGGHPVKPVVAPADAGGKAAPGQADSGGGSGPEFVGSNACRRCHFREYRSWQETPHAGIFELLTPGVRPEAKRRANLDPDRDYRDNEFCLKCHTVGYGEPGGFVSIEETPELAGVGCESCHGPGGDYIADDVMGKENMDHSFREVIEAGLIYPVPEEVCLRCHGEETPFNASVDPEYAFEYSRETLDSATHTHPTLRRDHGPLPEGVFFQEEYDGGGES